jgi:hypothetical protein
MGLNCGASCAKYVLFVFNIVFFLGGAAVLGVGIWLRVDAQSFTSFLVTVDPKGDAASVTNNIIGDNVSYIHTVAWVLIGIGSFVFLVGFMGCCGACKEWRPLLIGYAICLIIIMCAEIGVGIAVGVYKDQAVGELKKEMTNSIISKYSYVGTTSTGRQLKVDPYTSFIDDTFRAATNGMNTLHILFGCCGLDNFTDLITSNPSNPYSGGGHRDAPAFCCKFDKPERLELTDPDCANTRTSLNSYKDTGCIKKVEDFVQLYAPAVIGVAVGIGLIELVGIFFAFCLCCAIGDKRKYR